jgi:hypothetical protein
VGEWERERGDREGGQRGREIGVRSAEALMKDGDMKPCGLPRLLKLMDALYNSKGAQVRDCLRSMFAELNERARERERERERKREREDKVR